MVAMSALCLAMSAFMASTELAAALRNLFILSPVFLEVLAFLEDDRLDEVDMVSMWWRLLFEIVGGKLHRRLVTGRRKPMQNENNIHGFVA